MKYGSLPNNDKNIRQVVHTPTNFWDDFQAHGSVPHSIMVATTIGVVCGISAWLYYAFLEAALDFLWKTLPEMWMGDDGFLAFLPAWTWIPLVGFVMAIGLGLTVRFLGDPGDLPYTIKCVHSEKAYIGMDHVLPMVVASQCSILGGGSLGPEAPLVAICAAVGGYVSRVVFKCTESNVIRKHTLMGMAGALAAFFGCPLGGSLFALEVNSRFGIEYFEHTVEAILCGEVCLVVFRALARLPISPIWTLNAGLKLDDASPLHIAYGMGIGLVGASVAAGFAFMHRNVLGGFRKAGLLASHHQAVNRALVGAVVILGIGIMIPATLFWGEYEFETVATLGPSSSLTHVWPTQGAVGFEMDNFVTCLVVGVAKLIAISFTVAGGYRGGFIFPLFTAGAALGRALYFIFPAIPVQVCVLCMAAALNVAITRTSIATTLILAYLAGEQNAVSAILAASVTSLCATAYMPFMATQVCRSDLEASLFRFDDESSDKGFDDASGATNESTPLTTMHKGGQLPGSIIVDV